MQGSIVKLFFGVYVLNILPKVMVGLATVYISRGTALCFLQVASTFPPLFFFFNKKVPLISSANLWEVRIDISERHAVKPDGVFYVVHGGERAMVQMCA